MEGRKLRIEYVPELTEEKTMDILAEVIVTWGMETGAFDTALKKGA